jgi:acetyl-CoA acetyltransferase
MPRTSPRSVVLVAPVRTAIGTFGGSLKDTPAPELGAAAIREAVARAGLKPEEIHGQCRPGRREDEPRTPGGDP